LLTFGTSTLPGYGVQGDWIALAAALTCAALALMALFRRVSLKQLGI
jgi:MATE family multidrug resistance protein